MKRVDRFRRGETTYTCQACKKLTRNVGGDEAAARLCLDCYDLAGIENFLSDNGDEETLAQYGDEIRRTFKRRPELIPTCPELAKLLGIS